MKLDFRSVLILAVPILVLFALIFALKNWAYNHAEFEGGWALVAVYAAVIVLTLMASPQRGRPSVLRRDMEDRKHGAPGGCAPGHYLPPARSHRTFASTVGGHMARWASNLKQLVGLQIGGQSPLTLARSRA
ncbi:MAG: hypothetical protein ACK4SL_03370 [Candidatus Paceibacteria bacterium]